MKPFRSLKSFLFFSLIFICSSLFGQSLTKELITIKGIIVGQDSQPIPGVNIVSIGESGQTFGTITDLDGAFKIKIPKGSNLRISFVGMSSLEIVNINFSNIKVKFMTENDLIEFCCTNHQISHCAVTIKEMQKLTKKYNCSFK